MSERDAAAAEFYADPENRKPQGPMRKRSSQNARLSSHVPIRFDALTINAVKQLADEDGITVSSWIRSLVERAVRRRLAVTSTGREVVPSVQLQPQAATSTHGNSVHVDLTPAH